MCMCFTSCGHTHTWQDATCTTPRTCTECGETEGEPLAHSWVDATCTAPKTCSVCGGTEGEPLAHSWVDATCTAPKTCSVCGGTEGEALPHTLSEANYQSPAVCSACGEAVGDPLTPAFESSELDVSNFKLAELGVTYDYHGLAWDDYSVAQTNHLTFENYRAFPSDDAYPAKDGYEWRSVHYHFLCDDPSVQTLGWMVWYGGYDYYSGSELTMPIGEYADFTVNYNGLDYECRSTCVVEQEWISRAAVDCDIEFIVQVPVGYDGIVAIAGEHFPGDTVSTEAGEATDIMEASGQTLHYIRLDA